MKKTTIVALLFAASSIVSCNSSSAESGKAKIVLDCGKEFNWGDVWLSAEMVLETKIKIFNPGTDTLKITEVKPSCGCTTAPIDKDRIAPGDSAELDVKLHPGSMPTPIDKTITIRSNSSENPSLTVHLKANLRTTLATESKFLAFNLVKAGTPTEAIVRLSNDSDEDITITDFSTEPSDMKLSIRKGDVITKHSKIEIRCSFVPRQARMYQPMITLKTTDKAFPEMKFMGRCEVVDYDPYSPSK